MVHIFTVNVNNLTFAAAVKDCEAEVVLGQVMKSNLGFKTPTKKFKTWMNRLENLNYVDYQTVVEKLIRSGYGL